LACNRCSRGSHTSEIQAEPGGATTGAGGAGPEEVVEGGVVDCPDHTPCNFVRGKPQSIISFLISEDAIKYYVIYIIALGDRCW
jgi:formate-dependent nitrite reductase cytochrome c552 subunit